MQYCPKCGNKVDDAMTFCPNCGIQLKGPAATQAAPPEPNKEQEKVEEKHERSERAGKKEKVEHDYIYFLASGLILITIGAFATFELTNPALMSGQYLATMLIIIGLIVVLAAVYAFFSGRKSFSPKPVNQPNEKQPIKPVP
jgi:uncharacterized membrane protein YvbJ